jgi:hypothetical protein
MSIQQQVVLRYRAEGHLRFDLPSTLRGPGLGERLAAGLRALEGVYRVSVAERQGKLSIRYLATVCDVSAVARGLHALVSELAEAAAPDCCCAPASTTQRAIQSQGSGTGLKSWLRAKAQEAKETTEALGILARAGLEALNQRPRWLTEFLNDLLMLYLIKLHWHHILYLWLPNPWRHRYEWMATFYLIYLSVQARLPKSA